MRPGHSHTPGLGGKVNRVVDVAAKAHRKRIDKELSKGRHTREKRGTRASSQVSDVSEGDE